MNLDIKNFEKAKKLIDEYEFYEFCKEQIFKNKDFNFKIKISPNNIQCHSFEIEIGHFSKIISEIRLYIENEQLETLKKIKDL